MFTRRIIQKPFALLIAFMLLIAPAGLAIDVHLCKGSIKNISLFGTAEDCVVAAELATQCPTIAQKPEKITQISKIPCCTNYSYFSKADINSTPSSVGNATIHGVAVLHTGVCALASPVAVSSQAQNCAFSPPDLFAQKITVLYQTFRI